ncbi:MAG TPA: nitrate reductase associated protein [Chitinophagaceae bacterium]|nr:nitrate reductase associated protein [Chitinophagaceae bacterium]
MIETDSMYFEFEEDFVEDNVRCIPMLVRFKLDACGIKLKLNEWSKMSVHERMVLAGKNCITKEEVADYYNYLYHLIFRHTGKQPTELPVETNPGWANKNELPGIMKEKLDESGWTISRYQWQQLTGLQRFVLVKLCRPGHENKNFPKAMKEFGLV